MNIGELKAGSKPKKKRVGRGPGSGLGKTSGRGHKGYGQRSGSTKRPWFEGGQMPLQRRIPKRGFHPLNRKVFQLVKISSLERYDAGSTVTPETMKESGLVKKADQPIKILGDGELTKQLTVQADKFTKSAKEKISHAGGDAQIRSQSATAITRDV